VWQQYIDEHPQADAFHFLSVAVDAETERVRQYAEAHSFPTVVDSANVLGRTFDFDVVPNLLVIDEVGVVRFLHVGGFYLGRPELRQQVDALVTADFGHGERPAFARQESIEIEVIRGELAHAPNDPDILSVLGDALLREGRSAESVTVFQRVAELRPDDWSAAFSLGTALRATGDREGALRWWRRALSLDQQNFTVRKQIWREEHPERFYPTIDAEWQKDQLRLEGYQPPPKPA
jgi:tetratricopeptide (TPR) repeat protein